jgi:outer membrane lipoprotein SlyB
VAAVSIIVFSALGIGILLYGGSSATNLNGSLDGSLSASRTSVPAVLPGSPSAAPDQTSGDSVELARSQAPNPAESGPLNGETLLSDGSILAPIDESPAAAPNASAACAQCATVIALHEVKVEGEGTGLGAVGGGVVGGVVGNTVGDGRGRSLMTVLGAIGGAFAGNAIEKNARSKVDYELVVRYEDGHTRRFKRAQPWPYRVGEPVRVVKGDVQPRRG